MSLRLIFRLQLALWVLLPVLSAKETASIVNAQPAALSPLTTWSITPTRVVWTSHDGIHNAHGLIQPNPAQALLKDLAPPCVLSPEAGKGSGGGVLLDFGTEIVGSVEIITSMAGSKEPPLVRIRFGESANEAMAELGEATNAENDHALRDMTVRLPWLGRATLGNTGFRFVRIDNVDPKLPIKIAGIRALMTLRNVPEVGSFRCDDERINQIWQVGAYTVHLNMQEYLWDGIKRDRLVWIGDMGPEVSTINAVFGFNEVVPRSLDLARDSTPPSEWMDDISSYSMWWVLIHEQWWMHHGDLGYLSAQKPYLQKLLRRLSALVGPDGHEKIDGMRFLDWPSSSNQAGVTAGLQALLTMTLESGERLMQTLNDPDTARICRDAARKAHSIVPDCNGSKSGASLLALANMADPKEVADRILKPGGAVGISTFYGFYVLQALGKADEIDPALDFISSYWGGMLDLGATTFWEEFDLSWSKNAGRIDELVPPGKIDVHGTYGAFSYIGYRRSLCHGWASGPTAWLSETILGITPLEPGFKRVRVHPQLGRLKWAEGTYPTPFGPIHVRHERQADGTIKSQVQAPLGVIVDR